MMTNAAQAANPTTVNVPLCLDLTLNWLLNVYDWSVDFHYDDHDDYDDDHHDHDHDHDHDCDD